MVSSLLEKITYPALREWRFVGEVCADFDEFKLIPTLNRALVEKRAQYDSRDRRNVKDALCTLEYSKHEGFKLAAEKHLDNHGVPQMGLHGEEVNSIHT